MLRSTCLVSVLAIVAVAGCSSAESGGGVHSLGTAPTKGAPGGSGASGGSTGSSGDGTGGDATETTAPTETWSDGKTLDSSVLIDTGSIVQIDPGAKITVSPKVTITIKGTLRVKSGATHAKLTGTSWTGIVIQKGGILDADGLDIEKTDAAIAPEAGGTAKLANVAITDSGTPFSMKAGSTVTIAHSSVTANGPSAIAGSFTASYLDYDKRANEGLQLSDPAGSMIIADSTLHGSGGGDFVVSASGKLVHVEYTTISGAHCGFHFDAVDKFEIDHVSDDTNSWGAMLYGSGAGPNTISWSNFRDLSADLDMQGTNGPLTIDHTFTGGKDTLTSSANVTSPEQNAVPDARPHAQ